MEAEVEDGRPYDFVELLGKGAFGKVYRCLSLETNEECAVKILSRPTLHSEVDSIRNEVRILSSLNHPNIVRFRTLRQSRKHIYIEMELLRGGTLKAMLDKRRFSDEEASIVMKGILQAVAYLHRQGIIHRDLKPANIMFGSETELGNVKVTDFGLSAKFEKGNYYEKLYQNCGTMSFMAPEQADQRRYSRPVDIWSCGIILHVVATGKHPLLSKHDNKDTYAAKLQNPVWKISSRLTPLARDLFERMVDFTPLTRYTAEQVLNHPWITRNGNAIPRTYIERLQTYNDESKLNRLILKSCALAVLSIGSEFPKGAYQRLLEQIYHPAPAEPLLGPQVEVELTLPEPVPRFLSPQKIKERRYSSNRFDNPAKGKRLSVCNSPAPPTKPTPRKFTTARFTKYPQS
jgi:calcium/calmodulin-dependent protein kinase I